MYHNIVEVKSPYRTTTSHKEQPQLEVIEEDTASFFNLKFFIEDMGWERINSAFGEISWTSQLQGLNMNVIIMKFFEICLATMLDHIPKQ